MAPAVFRTRLDRPNQQSEGRKAVCRSSPLTLPAVNLDHVEPQILGRDGSNHDHIPCKLGLEHFHHRLHTISTIAS